MPKPNSKKKESVSANLQEDDLPSNFEKSEIENDTLILGEAAPSARKNNQKSRTHFGCQSRFVNLDKISLFVCNLRNLVNQLS